MKNPDRAPAVGPSHDVRDTANVVRHTRTTELLLVTVGIALLSALAELALLAVMKFGLGSTLRLAPSVVWMTPVSVLAIFLLFLIPLLLLARVWPRLGRLSTIVATCLFLGGLGFLLVERRLNVWALVLLSLGVAVQAGRLAERYRDGFMRVARMGTLVLLVLFVAGAAFVEGGLVVRERNSEAQLPAPPAAAPNVLFIILDTVRSLNLSLYGYARQTTPNLDRLAQRGVTFERAIVPGTWTVPSHGSMLTGRWPHELDSWWRREKRPPYTPLAEVLRDRGYRTGAFVGNWYHIGRESGLAHGFTHYSDLDRGIAQIARGSGMVRWLFTRRRFKEFIGLYETLGRRDAPSVSGSFLRWVGQDRGRPFFAMLNYFDAHSPYLPPPPFDARFDQRVAGRLPVVIEELNLRADPDPELVQIETAAYDGAIAYLDNELGKLFEELERRGVLENTIVIVTADHGEELGEHGRWGHAYSLHAEVVHVPLIVIAPGAPAGARVTEPASLRNIPATVAELAQVDGMSFPGISLADHWRAAETGATVEDTVLSVFTKYRSLYGDGHHFLEGVFDEREHLYDYTRDPLEQHDLADSPEAADVLARMRAAVTRLAPIRERPATDPNIPPPGT